MTRIIFIKFFYVEPILNIFDSHLRDFDINATIMQEINIMERIFK
jgi:hypothetical protein